MLAHRIQFPEPNQAVLAEFEVPAPTGDQLLLRTEYSIISAGTEGAIYSGLELEHPGRGPTFSYPRLTTGYANVARVEAVGPDQTRFRPGDRVLTFAPHASYWIWEGDRFALPIPEQLPGERAVFIRMAGIGMTALRRSSVSVGDRVAVLGLGLVGNLTAQVFQLAGAQVLGVDLERPRLEQAIACGLSDLAQAGRRPVSEVLRDWSGGMGARITVEAVGDPQLIEQAILGTRRLGEVILLGSPRKRVQMDVTPMLSRIHLVGVSVIGALEWLYPLEETEFSRFSVMENYRQLARWIGEERLVVDPLRTHVVAPAACQEVYQGVVHQKDRYTGVVFDWSMV